MQGTPLAFGGGTGGDRLPAFNPQGTVAAVASGSTVSLYSIAPGGAFMTPPLQTVDAGAIMPAGRIPTSGLQRPAWSPDGSLLAVVGADSGTTFGVLYSFAGGRLTAVPGSPFEAGVSAQALFFTSDGFLYNVQGIGSVATTISAYRVSPSRVETIQSLSTNAVRYASFLMHDKVLVLGLNTFLKQSDGTLRPVANYARGQNQTQYQVNETSNFVFPAGPAGLVFSATRFIGPASKIFFTVAIDPSGRMTSASDDGVIATIGDVGFATATFGAARDGRVVLARNSVQGTIRAWLVRDNGSLAETPTTLSFPDVTIRSGFDPTGQFAYFIQPGTAGIKGLRVAADGSSVTFDALPSSSSYRGGATILPVVFNHR